jgi:hypothetical protein
MGQASSSSSASTGINAAGGSITKNSPGVWTMAIAGLVLLFGIWAWLKARKN